MSELLGILNNHLSYFSQQYKNTTLINETLQSTQQHCSSSHPSQTYPRTNPNTLTQTLTQPAPSVALDDIKQYYLRVIEFLNTTLASICLEQHAAIRYPNNTNAIPSENCITNTNIRDYTISIENQSIEHYCSSLLAAFDNAPNTSNAPLSTPNSIQSTNNTKIYSNLGEEQLLSMVSVDIILPNPHYFISQTNLSKAIPGTILYLANPTLTLPHLQPDRNDDVSANFNEYLLNGQITTLNDLISHHLYPNIPITPEEYPEQSHDPKVSHITSQQRPHNQKNLLKTLQTIVYNRIIPHSNGYINMTIPRHHVFIHLANTSIRSSKKATQKQLNNMSQLHFQPSPLHILFPYMYTQEHHIDNRLVTHSSSTHIPIPSHEPIQNSLQTLLSPSSSHTNTHTTNTTSPHSTTSALDFILKTPPSTQLPLAVLVTGLPNVYNRSLRLSVDLPLICVIVWFQYFFFKSSSNQNNNNNNSKASNTDTIPPSQMLIRAITDSFPFLSQYFSSFTTNSSRSTKNSYDTKQEMPFLLYRTLGDYNITVHNRCLISLYHFSYNIHLRLGQMANYYEYYYYQELKNKYPFLHNNNNAHVIDYFSQIHQNSSLFTQKYWNQQHSHHKCQTGLEKVSTKLLDPSLSQSHFALISRNIFDTLITIASSVTIPPGFATMIDIGLDNLFTTLQKVSIDFTMTAPNHSPYTLIDIFNTEDQIIDTNTTLFRPNIHALYTLLNDFYLQIQSKKDEKNNDKDATLMASSRDQNTLVSNFIKQLSPTQFQLLLFYYIDNHHLLQHLEHTSIINYLIQRLKYSKPLETAFPPTPNTITTTTTTTSPSQTINPASITIKRFPFIVQPPPCSPSLSLLPYYIPPFLQQYYSIFKLNHSQQRVINNALCLPYSILYGPPGTGKTFVASHLVALYLTVNTMGVNNIKNVNSKPPSNTHLDINNIVQPRRILLSGHSHSCVDQMMLKVVTLFQNNKSTKTEKGENATNTSQPPNPAQPQQTTWSILGIPEIEIPLLDNSKPGLLRAKPKQSPSTNTNPNDVSSTYPTLPITIVRIGITDVSTSLKDQNNNHSKQDNRNGNNNCVNKTNNGTSKADKDEQIDDPITYYRQKLSLDNHIRNNFEINKYAIPCTMLYVTTLSVSILTHINQYGIQCNILYRENQPHQISRHVAVTLFNLIDNFNYFLSTSRIYSFLFATINPGKLVNLDHLLSLCTLEFERITQPSQQDGSKSEYMNGDINSDDEWEVESATTKQAFCNYFYNFFVTLRVVLETIAGYKFPDVFPHTQSSNTSNGNKNTQGSTTEQQQSSQIIQDLQSKMSTLSQIISSTLSSCNFTYSSTWDKAVSRADNMAISGHYNSHKGKFCQISIQLTTHDIQNKCSPSMLSRISMITTLYNRHYTNLSTLTVLQAADVVCGTLASIGRLFFPVDYLYKAFNSIGSTSTDLDTTTELVPKTAPTSLIKEKKKTDYNKVEMEISRSIIELLQKQQLAAEKSSVFNNRLLIPGRINDGLQKSNKASKNIDNLHLLEDNNGSSRRSKKKQARGYDNDGYGNNHTYIDPTLSHQFFDYVDDYSDCYNYYDKDFFGMDDSDSDDNDQTLPQDNLNQSNYSKLHQFGIETMTDDDDILDLCRRLDDFYAEVDVLGNNKLSHLNVSNTTPNNPLFPYPILSQPMKPRTIAPLITFSLAILDETSQTTSSMFSLPFSVLAPAVAISPNEYTTPMTSFTIPDGVQTIPPRCVLIGDTNQLPPTVTNPLLYLSHYQSSLLECSVVSSAPEILCDDNTTSNISKDELNNQSDHTTTTNSLQLFESFHQQTLLAPAPVTMLNTQYRMHASIGKVISAFFYKNALNSLNDDIITEYNSLSTSSSNQPDVVNRFLLMKYPLRPLAPNFMQLRTYTTYHVTNAIQTNQHNTPFIKHLPSYFFSSQLPIQLFHHVSKTIQGTSTLIDEGDDRDSGQMNDKSNNSIQKTFGSISNPTEVRYIGLTVSMALVSSLLSTTIMIQLICEQFCNQVLNSILPQLILQPSTHASNPNITSLKSHVITILTNTTKSNELITGMYMEHIKQTNTMRKNAQNLTQSDTSINANTDDTNTERFSTRRARQREESLRQQQLSEQREQQRYQNAQAGPSQESFAASVKLPEFQSPEHFYATHQHTLMAITNYVDANRSTSTNDSSLLSFFVQVKSIITWIMSEYLLLPGGISIISMYSAQLLLLKQEIIRVEQTMIKVDLFTKLINILQQTINDINKVMCLLYDLINNGDNDDKTNRRANLDPKNSSNLSQSLSCSIQVPDTSLFTSISTSVNIMTVDSSQGTENDLVLLSTVRNFVPNEVSFHSNNTKGSQRINTNTNCSMLINYINGRAKIKGDKSTKKKQKSNQSSKSIKNSTPKSTSSNTSLKSYPHLQQPSLGFLTDRRRVNVALSRAKRGVIIFGNAFLLCTTHNPHQGTPTSSQSIQNGINSISENKTYPLRQHVALNSPIVFFNTLSQLYRWFNAVCKLKRNKTNLYSFLDQRTAQQGHFWKRLVLLLLSHQNVLDAKHIFPNNNVSFHINPSPSL